MSNQNEPNSDEFTDEYPDSESEAMAQNYTLYWKDGRIETIPSNGQGLTGALLHAKKSLWCMKAIAFYEAGEPSGNFVFKDKMWQGKGE
jgi:hypothetical protein